MPHAFIIAKDGYLSWIKRDTMPIYLGKCVLSDFASCPAVMEHKIVRGKTFIGLAALDMLP